MLKTLSGVGEKGSNGSEGLWQVAEESTFLCWGRLNPNSGPTPANCRVSSRYTWLCLTWTLWKYILKGQHKWGILNKDANPAPQDFRQSSCVHFYQTLSSTMTFSFSLMALTSHSTVKTQAFCTQPCRTKKTVPFSVTSEITTTKKKLSVIYGLLFLKKIKYKSRSKRNAVVL